MRSVLLSLSFHAQGICPKGMDHEVRVVTYNGRAVKKQHRTPDGQIKIRFYDAPPEVVSVEEWKRNTQNQYYAPGIRRREVVHQQNQFETV